MGKIVQVNPGYHQVFLPDFRWHNAGDQVTVTDAEYAALAANTLRLITIVNNSVADPTRPPRPPVSLMDALTEAMSYTDSQVASHTGAVSSVAGRTGAVTLSTTDISGLGTAATASSSSFDAAGAATAAQTAAVASSLQKTGNLSDLNNAATARANLAVAFKDASIFNVRDPAYGAVGNGTTDDTAAFTAAAAAMVTAGSGILYVPAGTYKVTSLPTFTPVSTTGPLPYAVRGAGSESTIFLPFGTTLASSLTVNNPGFSPNNPSTGAPVWGGFTVNLANAGSAVVGISWSDVSYGTFEDICIRNGSANDGFYFPNTYGWTEGMKMRSCRSITNLNAVHYAVGLGAGLGTVSTTIANASTGNTSVAVSGGVSKALYSGQKIVIYPGSGTYSQTLTTTAAVTQGATSIPVSSFTAGAAYTSGTATVNVGAYGSFDYHDIDLYISAQANCSGLVSEIPLGLSENISRVGSTMKIKGNFSAAATNTGKFLWAKGLDSWTQCTWDIQAEPDGTGTNHISVQLDNGSAAVSGYGIFNLPYFAGAVFNGGTYQFSVSGQVCVKGVSDSAGTATRQFTSGRATNISGGVTPSGYRSTAPTSGTQYQNTTGYDLSVIVPITFTGTGTLSWAEASYGTGPAASWSISGTTGQTVIAQFIHHHQGYIRVDVTNATIGIPVATYA